MEEREESFRMIAKAKFHIQYRHDKVPTGSFPYFIWQMAIAWRLLSHGRTTHRTRSSPDWLFPTRARTRPRQ